MPLLPTTRRSASQSSASSTSAFAGFPLPVRVTHSMPSLWISLSVRARISRSWAAGFHAHSRSSTLPDDDPAAGSRYELSRKTFASKRRAISTATSTALLAVSEPSVPTAILEIISAVDPTRHAADNGFRSPVGEAVCRAQNRRRRALPPPGEHLHPPAR